MLGQLCGSILISQIVFSNSNWNEPVDYCLHDVSHKCSMDEDEDSKIFRYFSGFKTERNEENFKIWTISVFQNLFITQPSLNLHLLHKIDLNFVLNL